MKVLNVCVDDWANFSHNIANSLRSIGVDCDDVKLNKHHHNYSSQSKLLTSQQINDIVGDYDIINCIHNNFRLFSNYYRHAKDKIHNVFYTGTDYRINHIHLTDYFNHFVKNSVICLGEFAPHKPKNMKYFIGGTELQPTFRNLKHPLTIGHFPSNPTVKGTDRIKEVISKINSDRFKFICDGTSVSHDEHLKRLDSCDIYIELFAETNNGMKYGSWGLTAMEAASLGKIVLTMNLSDNVYQEYYGSHALQLFTNENELISKIKEIINKPLNELEEMQRQSYEWVNTKHSLKASGEYLLKIIQ